MALTQADLDRLDQAIATGQLSLEFQGRRVTYRNVPELLAARAHVATVLAASGADGGVPKRAGSTYKFQFTTGRGD